MSPILLLIVFATIEYGWYLTNCIVINSAVAEGARAAVKARDWETESHGIEDPVQFARAALTEALWTIKKLAANHVKAIIIPADETGPRRIEVTVTGVSYQPITGYLGQAMLPATISAKAVMTFP